MKLFYMTNARIPTEKAHGLQILKMCEAFQQQGIQVELIVPTRVQSQAMKQVQSIWQHYDITTPFRIRKILAPDFVQFSRKIPAGIIMWFYYLQCLFFSTIAVCLHLFTPHSVYYSRDLQTVLVLCLTKWLHRKPVYFEAHKFHGEGGKRGFLPFLYHNMMRWMLRHVDGLIVITHQLKRYYSGLGIDEHRVLVLPDGVDRKRFSSIPDRKKARQKLHISLDRTVICYTGHLFQWKGVYTLAESARYLPQDYLVYIVGGMEPDILALQEFVHEQGLSNVVIPGYVPYSDIPEYIGAADVVVVPNTAKARISREYTSPLKLFEYMGSKRPIVASDLPSLREVLRHKDNAYLVQPDNPKNFAEGIFQVIQNKELAEHMIAMAYTDVQEYTWDVRAKKVLTFFQQP